MPSMERPLSSAAVMPLSEKTTAVPSAALWDAKAAGTDGSSTASDKSTAASCIALFFRFKWFILSVRAAGARDVVFGL